MSTVNVTTLYHTNKYDASSACQECGGVVRHTDWCSTGNPVTAYARAIVEDAGKVTIADRLILHALGVVWT